MATALILYTGANTPFTGFPFLASFIAEDSFLPRQMTRRGHRLAFSNGIIVLTVTALALLLGVGAHVDKLIPFYAIGVFTGFTMAGFGMAKHYKTHREPGWRRKIAVSVTGGSVSLLVVLIFAVVKFTEGAWLVVVLFPVLWLILIRLNTQYRSEARALDVVAAAGIGAAADCSTTRATSSSCMVDRLDLAVIRALRYAGSLRPTDVRAVHLVIDTQVGDELQYDWISRGLGDRVPLDLVECPDRRLVRGASQVALNTVIQEHAEVTLLLPRRSFRRVSQRLLHDRTADRIAAAAARIPHVAATIVPFDTVFTQAAENRLEAQQRRAAGEPALATAEAPGSPPEGQPAPHQDNDRGTGGVTPIGTVSGSSKSPSRAGSKSSKSAPPPANP